MILDLDRVKAVNDTLGHPVGDKLLAQVAARLRSIMERGMTCGRLGGDEFAIVLPNVPGAKEAEDLAHRIIATLSRPYVVDNHQLFVGASVRSEEHTSELQSLMRISYAVFCLKK